MRFLSLFRLVGVCASANCASVAADSAVLLIDLPRAEAKIRGSAPIVNTMLKILQPSSGTSLHGLT